MMTPRQIEAIDRRRAATHEAGHVIAARLCGVPVLAAWIERAEDADPDERLWLGRVTYTGYATPAARRIIGCAGFAAELVAERTAPETDLWLDADCMSPSDWSLAECKPGEPDGLCCDAIERLAAAFADPRHWRAVQIEARRLIIASRPNR